MRAAYWLAVHLVIRGEIGGATGWLGRAQRLVEHEPGDCVELGYLASADALRSQVAGDWSGTRAAAADAVDIGERFGDPDLVALGLMDLGRALIEEGLVAEGLAKLDEAMVAATGGELSPVATGFVYCSVIHGCQTTYELARAREWTLALTDWCAQQPDLVPFTGTCLVHRAEILQVQGAWDEALVEARLACERFTQRGDRRATGESSYRCGEILRVRGDLAGAEQAFREASRHGREPQPGLALLRLAQGRTDAAAAAITVVVDAAAGWAERARLLPAYVEIALAAGQLDPARAACDELDEIARRNGRTMLLASAAQARGRSSSRAAMPAPPPAAPPRLAALARAGGAVRGGARAPAGRRGLPVDGRRRDRRAGARGGARGARAAGRGGRRRARRVGFCGRRRRRPVRPDAS